VAAVLREHRPKVMVCHNDVDYHPDHIQAHHICLAARFYGKFTKTDIPGEPHYVPRIFFFGPMHLPYAFKPSFIIALEQADFDRKVEAIRCYESQFAARDWLGKLEAYNRYFGGLIGRPYGEPFAARTELGLDSFESIL
jgi:LmbE family N-acetylglucosaminyl deacetylase